MTTPIGQRLDQVLARLPLQFSGPGGAVAVLREGEVLARHGWGWADTARRVPFTPETMFLVCSITKQFTCALLLELFPDPTELDAALRERLAMLQEPAPGILDLCHNQSGLRDYWALAMLCGSPVEAPFGAAQAAALIGRTRTLQFRPGTRYSYCNQNFRLLSDIIEARTGRPYAELLRDRILAPAGMATARLNPDTSAVPGGTIGYEGSVEDGFRPAVNRIHWTGDAGLSASLDDLVAWERFIDATRDDRDGIYNRLSAPTAFRDGTPARYGFGLARANLLGQRITGHGGGLRGWHSFRFYAPEQRVSVVVLFNHMAEARACAQALFAAVLDQPPAPAAPPAMPPTGCFQDPETHLAVRLEAADDGLRLHFGTHSEQLAASGPASWSNGPVTVACDGEGVRMTRAVDNHATLLAPVPAEPVPPADGVFHCAELDATLTVAGGYAAFSGSLGNGAMEMLQPFAGAIWLYPCPRALDAAAPGDWTLEFDAAGVRVGCWLARDIRFTRAPG